jgi:glycosyltransferase involved in cell wall biosynthesis
MISTLHDLQHFYYPEFFSKEEIAFRNIYYKKSAEFSERIVVSFEHVKDDIVHYFNIPSEKIDVCPLGFDNHKDKDLDQNRFPEIRRKYKLPAKYLFYSANTWKHKNHIRLIKALKLVHEQYGHKIALVCTGEKYDNYFPKIEETIHQSNLSEFVNFTGYIPEEDTHLLLKNAALSIIPTLYEAGSFPLMEAMFYNVPVICSNVTSLPQTIGDRRFLFDPWDTEQMAEKITDMLKDKKLIDENRENSRKRVRESGWDRVVLNFVDSYTKAIKDFRQDKAVSDLKMQMQNYELLMNKIIEREEGKIKNELLRSTSWKATKPLRFINSFFKKNKSCK